MSFDEYKRRMLKSFTTSGGLKVTVKPITSPILLLKLSKVYEEAGVKPGEPPRDLEEFWKTLEPVMRTLFRECVVEPKLTDEDFDDKLKYAVAELPNIKLKKYTVKFEFQDVD